MTLAEWGEVPSSVFVGHAGSKRPGACARGGQSDPVLRREGWAQDTAPETQSGICTPETSVCSSVDTLGRVLASQVNLRS